MIVGKPRRILLTGATSGIGLELAKRWAYRHELLLTGRKLSPELEELCERFDNCRYTAIDQTDPSIAVISLQRALERLEWDRLDHAVLNAGTGFVCHPGGESTDQMVATINTNLTSTILFSHTLYPFLEKNKGLLTLMGSTAHKGAPNFASYAASKSGLNGFARSLRAEWQGRVDVQILNPGPTRTDMHQKAGLKIGAMRSLFVPAPAMASMIDGAIRRRTARQTISFMRYWAGEALLARGLQ